MTLVLLLLAALVWSLLPRHAERQRPSPTGTQSAHRAATALPRMDESQRERLSEAYGKLPLSFEANTGQADARVKFLSRGQGYNLFLTPTEAVIALRHTGAGSRTQDASPSSS
ncbi:MAG: hypothetical protein LC802_11080, partial [Acidobacteria bacterium]|nr:hypothetical protein [Acidobacteriota bacterium]